MWFRSYLYPFATFAYQKLDDLSVADVHIFLNYERHLELNAHLNDVVVSPSAKVISKQTTKIETLINLITLVEIVGDHF